MRTNIELDDSLIKQALKISGFKTKKDIVNEALKQYVASLKRRQILTVRGADTWSGNLEDMRSL
ncbi:type II toxin-antitoxin system VapB family antitoxin [Parapedobacter sp. GCM10030251]|jgi:Transcription regulator of the Arc/MetJ class|uniref:type II toxin-antitoxin system VapB family antitoxin n=1 Tax=Parapedobacter sp. GCM10030251 TaxID=3273419 RepID=UPI00361C80EA